MNVTSHETQPKASLASSSPKPLNSPEETQVVEHIGRKRWAGHLDKPFRTVGRRRHRRSRDATRHVLHQSSRAHQGLLPIGGAGRSSLFPTSGPSPRLTDRPTDRQFQSGPSVRHALHVRRVYIFPLADRKAFCNRAARQHRNGAKWPRSTDPQYPVDRPQQAPRRSAERSFGVSFRYDLSHSIIVSSIGGDRSSRHRCVAAVTRARGGGRRDFGCYSGRPRLPSRHGDDETRKRCTTLLRSPPRPTTASIRTRVGIGAGARRDASRLVGRREDWRMAKWWWRRSPLEKRSVGGSWVSNGHCEHQFGESKLDFVVAIFRVPGRCCFPSRCRRFHCVAALLFAQTDRTGSANCSRIYVKRFHGIFIYRCLIRFPDVRDGSATWFRVGYADVQMPIIQKLTRHNGIKSSADRT